jgi:hypothetical protein
MNFIVRDMVNEIFEGLSVKIDCIRLVCVNNRWVCDKYKYFDQQFAKQLHTYISKRSFVEYKNCFEKIFYFLKVFKIMKKNKVWYLLLVEFLNIMQICFKHA